MQLPSSSTPTDSNPLASLFPATMPTGGKSLPAGAAKNGKAKFDDLVDDLSTDSAPAAATAAGPDASTIATVLSVSFLPIPVVCPGPVAEPTGNPTTDVDANVASENVPCGLDLPAAPDALTGT